MLRFMLIGLLLSFSAPALAVYKCESGGKVSYSDTPCPDGKEIVVEPVQASEASRAAKQLTREKKQLKRLESERHRDEAKVHSARQRAAKRQAALHKKCTSLARRERWAREDAAAATGKAANRAKLKARRAAERYEEECGGLSGLQMGG